MLIYLFFIFQPLISHFTWRVDCIVCSDHLCHDHHEDNDGGDPDTNEVVGEDRDHHAGGVDGGEAGPAKEVDHLPDEQGLVDTICEQHFGHADDSVSPMQLINSNKIPVPQHLT